MISDATKDDKFIVYERLHNLERGLGVCIT